MLLNTMKRLYNANEACLAIHFRLRYQLPFLNKVTLRFLYDSATSIRVLLMKKIMRHVPSSFKSHHFCFSPKDRNSFRYRLRETVKFLVYFSSEIWSKDAFKISLDRLSMPGDLLFFCENTARCSSSYEKFASKSSSEIF